MSDKLPVMYTVDEVSKFLKTSKQQVRIMIKANEIKAVKVGREFRIPDTSLDQWLKDNLIKRTNKEGK